MNLKVAISIFIDEHLRFGNPRHIAARDALRTATRSQKQETRDLILGLWDSIRRKYGIYANVQYETQARIY